MIKVAINGFGRIGRTILRAIHKEFNNLTVVAINDLLPADYLAYMLKYDSTHGRFKGDIRVNNNNLVVGDNNIRLTTIRDASQLKWHEVDADIVIDCTGLFLTTKDCNNHLVAGAKKVIQSAPSKDDTPMFVYGVNHNTYAGQNIVSAASCTTNCLAPVAKVVNDNWGINRGLMTTVHAATASQKTVDGASAKDWRGGRSVFDNIIPSSTGAAKAVGKVLPELNGKLTGMSFRIPSANVSVVDLTVELKTATSYQDVCTKMKEASVAGVMAKTLSYTEDSVVSNDFRGISYASIFDAKAGIALDGSFMKLISWYDNEYGYACNLLRLAEHIS